MMCLKNEKEVFATQMSETKKTIIYAGGFKLPDKNAAAQRVIANGKILRDLGYNVVFIDVAEDCGGDVIATKRNIFGFDCYSVQYPDSITAWFSYVTRINDVKKISHLYNNVSAVILYNYPAVAMSRLLNYFHKRNVKVIADSTEWNAKTHNIPKNIDTDMRMKKVHCKLDGVICISRYLDSYYKNKTKTVYLPPLTDKEESKWNQSRRQDGALNFTYAGKTGKYKDKLNMLLESLYEAAPQKPYQFNILGVSKEVCLSNYPEIKEVLDRLGENVKFRGRVSHYEALSYLRDSDFSIFFRQDTIVSRAGFPTKYVEAVTSGTPVITNKTSDLGEYLKDGKNSILIDGYEKKDITRAFERAFAMSKDEIDELKNNCAKEKETFDYRNYKTTVEKFMNNIVNNKG